MRGVHAIVSRRHARASELIDGVNLGLKQMKQSDAYGAIVRQHLMNTCGRCGRVHREAVVASSYSISKFGASSELVIRGGRIRPARIDSSCASADTRDPGGQLARGRGPLLTHIGEQQVRARISRASAPVAFEAASGLPCRLLPRHGKRLHARH